MCLLASKCLPGSEGWKVDNSTNYVGELLANVSIVSIDIEIVVVNDREHGSSPADHDAVGPAVNIWCTGTNHRILQDVVSNFKLMARYLVVESQASRRCFILRRKKRSAQINGVV